jgi:hypothetical protein
MNRSSVFLTAFWTGLAAPASLYAAAPSYRPAVNDLTSADSFGLVGVLLTEAMACVQNEQRTAAAASGEAGRSFESASAA